jgi:SAM-dependent methyltransferase
MLVHQPVTYSYARYLSSKRTVDDRALNKDVVRRLEAVARQRSPLNVLEVGAGLGTMLARGLEWGLIQRASYALLDVDEGLLKDARAWLLQWARAQGFELELGSDALRIRRGATIDVSVSFVRTELGHYLAGGPARAPADLLIANAFLDLVDVPTLLPQLLALVAPGGVYWFSVNYDGETIFQPEHDCDARFMGVYHRSMDERVRFGRPAGSSKTGRLLFGQLRENGASVIAAGASDWIVFAQGGSYEADEGYFLHHIIYTIDEELKQHQEIDPTALAEWVARRHDQINRGQLCYIAHQIDFVGHARV